MDDVVQELVGLLIKVVYQGIKAVYEYISEFFSDRKGKKKGSNKKEKKQKQKWREGDKNQGQGKKAEQLKPSSGGSGDSASSGIARWIGILFVTVNQGFIGLSSFNGVLQPSLLQPGVHFTWPIVQRISYVSISPQTTKILDIKCGTSSGLMSMIGKIQIVSRLQKSLAYETVKNYSNTYNSLFIEGSARHQMGEICSRLTLEEIYTTKFDQLHQQLKKRLSKDIEEWAPGIAILAIRITKPIIPESLLVNYEEVERLRGKLLLAIQHQKTTLSQLHTEGMKSITQAQSHLQVRTIELLKEIQQKQNEYSLQVIQAQMNRTAFITSIDNQFMLKVKSVEAEQAVFNRQTLQKHIVEVLEGVRLELGASQPELDVRI